MERVQVASIQTLQNREKPQAKIVIVDEAHRSKAKTWNEILDHYTDARICGFTATPWRLDNRPLLDVFEDTVIAATPSELVRDGYLVPVTGFSYDKPELRGVKKSHGDYNEGQLALVMGGSTITGNIIEKWQEHAANLSTVVFAVNVEHSKQLTQRFRDAGARAEHLDGTIAKAEREAILARVASGETQVICNVNVLTEGTDIPRLKCAILARPTMSVSLFIQMQGRVRRLFAGSIARIHDHGGCVVQHGLPDMDRDYTLQPAKIRRSGGGGNALGAVTTCKQCRAMYDAELYSACTVCGFANPARARTVQEVEGDEIQFEEIGKQFETAPAEKQREVYLQYLSEATERGYKPGFAAHRFRSRFGMWPKSKEWVQ